MLLVEDSRTRVESDLGISFTEAEALQLPLLVPSRRWQVVKYFNLGVEQGLSKAEILVGRSLHMDGGSISRMLREVKFVEPLISERTGAPLVINAYRSRYTRARQLARLGVTRGVLQHWLGHTSADSLEFYYDDPAERARVLNKEIAPLMAPLAQAFQGTLRDVEADAIRGEDGTSRIELDGAGDKGVGTCGNHGYCGASVPIPCYRCTKFQPWVYGPHHEVLERLNERQRQENSVPRAGQGRRLIIPIQLDRDIEAVKSIIGLCENRKAELSLSE
jgi:hypothetical protein